MMSKKRKDKKYISEENKETFGETADRIRKIYGHLIDFDSEQYQDVLMDIIEIWEDMEEVHSLYSGIVKGIFSDKEFKNAISMIEVLAWHTSDHLANLYKALSESDD